MPIVDLVLPDRARKLIRSRAIEALPDEACGLLVGPEPGVVAEAHACVNMDPSPHTFLIDPVDHRRVLLDAWSRGLRLVGSWHSHPRSGAEPSSYDLTHARGEPDWCYVIIGHPGNNERVEFSAYRIEERVSFSRVLLSIE